MTIRDLFTIHRVCVRHHLPLRLWVSLDHIIQKCPYIIMFGQKEVSPCLPLYNYSEIGDCEFVSFYRVLVVEVQSRSVGEYGVRGSWLALSCVSVSITILCLFPCTEQINPQVFEGCKVALGKGLSKFFQTTHTVTLGSSTQPANYQYGVTYVGSKKLSENDVSSKLLFWKF